VLDVAGQTCVHRDNDPPSATIKPGHQTVKPIEFSTADLCKATGVLLEHGGHYRVTILPGESGSQEWFNGIAHIGAPIGGFSAKDRPEWYERVYLSLFLPLRRELSQDWFRIMVRFGHVGGEEDAYVPDLYDPTIQWRITPTIAPEHKEELFIFVNDAVIGVPGLYDLLYRNNGGTAYLKVERTK
jgi:hypothetical protein